MKTIKTLAAGALIGSASFAGPLDKSRVPSDAGWVVHLDMEAALRSTVVQACLEAKEGLGLEGLDDLDEIKDEFGIDPLHDIKDATIFGRHAGGDDAVAILTTTAAVDGAIERLHAKGHDYAKVAEGGYDLYAWTDDGATQYGLVRSIGGDGRLLYLSKDKGRLIAAAELGSGRGESLRGRKDSALSPDPGEGSVLFVAADVIPRPGHAGPESMVLGKARAIRLEAGERGGECYADLELRMNSSEDATNVVQIFQGLQAMARMLCQNHPDLAPLKDLIDAETMSAREDTIVAGLRYPAARLLEAIKAAGDAEEGDGDGKAPEGKVEKQKKPL